MRDCLHCIHYKHYKDDIFACESWECNFERRADNENDGGRVSGADKEEQGS